MLEKRHDYLDQCPRCYGEMCVSEGFYGETLAWIYHFCDCGYRCEGELAVDVQDKLTFVTKEYWAKKANPDADAM